MTKDKDKLQNINDAMKIFEDWLKGYEKNNMSKEHRPYLPLDTVKLLSALKKKYNIEDKKSEAFIQAYKSVKGEYKNLRTVSSGDNEPTWDIVRNTHLKPIVKRIDEENPDMWEDDLPTKDHLELILWAYSPDATKIKKSLSKMEEKLGKGEEEEEEEKEDDVKSSDEDEKMSENGDSEVKKASKRKSEGSSSDDEESPKKKSKSKE